MGFYLFDSLMPLSSLCLYSGEEVGVRSSSTYSSSNGELEKLLSSKSFSEGFGLILTGIQEGVQYAFKSEIKRFSYKSGIG